jgi:ATP-binding cassette subfamily B protein
MPQANPRATKGARNMNMVSGKARNAAIRRLLSYVFKYYPVQFIVVLVCVLLSSFTNVAGGYFTGTVVVNEYIMPSLDSGSVEIKTPTSGAFAGIPFGGAIAIMASILAVGTIALYVYNILMSIIGQGVQKRIRDELYDHMQDLPISYFDRRGRGDIMSVYTNDVDALREMLSRALPMVANSIVTMIACFVMMLLTDLMLTGVVIGVSLIIFFIIIYFTKMASRFFIAQQIELGKMNGYIEEMVNGQRVVKVFNYEKRNIEGFKKHNEQFFNYSVKANRFANLLMPTVNQVGNIQYVLIALIGSLAVFNHLTGVSLMGTFTYGIATVGTIVSFLMYSKAFVQPIGNVSQQLNLIALALAGATRIFEIIDAPAEADNGYVELVNAKEDENGNPVEVAERTGKWAWKHPHTDGSPTTYTWLRGKITFNDVDFAYIPGKTVLHNISMYAEEGQKIAFVGPTGSGKTTITNLINRFYDIEDGKVRYDDININKIKKKDLRRSLGVVLQETKLFTGTVMENIRFGNLEATDEEVIAAAKLANAHNFITHLPDGYNTLLTSGGASLSQGQRQLIAIARAAVANPPVMILDEATSSIDSRTESLVQEGMDAIMKGRTVFVIAHRLSTIKNSDVIMVLQDGRIIERGSHDQLLAEKGKYYQLYTGNEIANK